MIKSQPHVPTLYLDVSCLNRPFDDQRQPRVRLESEAVLHILSRIDQGIWLHVSSEMALVEIDAITQSSRRKRILAMLPPPENIMAIDDAMMRRAASLRSLGIQPADALHVAAAESLDADALLTCDDRLLKTTARHAEQIGVRVVNPVVWIGEHEEEQNPE